MQTGAQRGRAHGGDGVQRESLFIPGAGVVPGEHVEEMEYRERALFIPGASTVPGEHVEEVEYRERACSFLGQVQFRLWASPSGCVTGWGGQGWMTVFRALCFSFLQMKQTTC